MDNWEGLWREKISPNCGGYSVVRSSRACLRRQVSMGRRPRLTGDGGGMQCKVVTSCAQQSLTASAATQGAVDTD
eukprot:10487284-Alexandrium_andersonii.AAC.1